MSACTKIRYYSEATAYLAIVAIARSTPAGRKVPVDYYPCTACSALHLTSHGKARRILRFRR